MSGGAIVVTPSGNEKLPLPDLVIGPIAPPVMSIYTAPYPPWQLGQQVTVYVQYSNPGVGCEYPTSQGSVTVPITITYANGQVQTVNTVGTLYCNFNGTFLSASGLWVPSFTGSVLMTASFDGAAANYSGVVILPQTAPSATQAPSISLTSKFLGLPLWAWILIGVGAAGAVTYFALRG